jgi:FAS-associated factor 2
MNDDDDEHDEDDVEEEEEESEEEDDDEEDSDAERRFEEELQAEVEAAQARRQAARGPRGWVAKVARLLTRPRLGTVGRSAARAFAQDYRKLCDSLNVGRPPAFYADSYRQAAASAAAQSKLLLIYLHSPLHQDSADFCKNGLTTPQFEAFCRTRFVLWGADVRSADGHALSDSLGATRYPFLAIVICDEAGEKVVASIHGASSDGGQLVSTLEGALAQQRGVLQALRRKQRARQEARRLRTEQDRDFNEGLERDRLREAQRQAEREEAQRVQRAEREARERAETEAAQAESARRARLGAEPPAGAGVARVRVQFPDGQRVDRRFLMADRVALLGDFVACHIQDAGLPHLNYGLATHYPLRELEGALLERTVAEAHLNGEVVYVHDLDA